MGSVNFQRHINVHLHNALIVQKPLDKSVKVTKRPMQMVKKESKMPKLKGVKGPGQSFMGGKDSWRFAVLRMDCLINYLNMMPVSQGELF